MEADLAVLDIELPPTVDELITEDGEPLESEWHRAAIALLIESLRYYWRSRHDVYVGGNMFIYYEMTPSRRPRFRGPDFYAVLDVDGSYVRKAWVVWEEGGRYPDIIIELLSPTTANDDLTTKKRLYDRVFRTSDYFCYEPDSQTLQGWTLNALPEYERLEPDAQARLWSRKLGLWLGHWEGEYLGIHAVWPRFFDIDGNLILTKGEAEEQRADVAEQRANEAVAENERLRARLRELGIDSDMPT